MLVYTNFGIIETVTKNMTLAKNGPIKKNPQFQCNKPEIKAIQPTHGLVILTKFHYYYVKIVDFFIIGKFLGQCHLFRYSL